MKNIILIALLAAAMWFGWMKFAVEVMPKQVARDFVEDLRQGIDHGVISIQISNWRPPLPEPECVVPKGGIEEHFSLSIENAAKITDPPDSRTTTFLVRFKNSATAPPSAPAGDNSYRIVLVDKGTYIMPKWNVTEFRPASARPLPKRPAPRR